MCHIVRARVSGRKFFQTRCINWSYRKRGKEARTHRKTVARVADLAMRRDVE